MSVGDLPNSIGSAVDRIRLARAAINDASSATTEAAVHLAEVTASSHDPDVHAATGALHQATSELGERANLLDIIESNLTTYCERLRGSGGDTGFPGPAPHAQGHAKSEASRPQPAPSRVERVRGELPTRVASGRGQKTHGRWWSTDVEAVPITSGVDARSKRVNDILLQQGCRYVPVTTSADVELKVAAQMRDEGIMHASLVINNRPCRGPLGCDSLLPMVLPRGAVLTVYGEDGFERRYEGGAG
ncbi:hypothetical protein BAY61_18230 [Prauserella marina]|uniref:SCP1.201-like deaminase n=1 Tax=Prauserella marina TaxID=530584 RepID=A0A222VRP8_9PSEU|nr:DddA-like double-stranded DNA deaminase toxin [Prauserella marina]ASR36616.1 hypothetical protein BAY61_18230 [Prauserella marina]PWV74030.1 nucleic acid/nucleotide deaminase of polymorphic system toxin [Prauserella marina]SDD61292.1 SCP1.201-like deaminase [Prauserella marina]